MPVRLPFGAWWLASVSVGDRGILVGDFEQAELRFVERYLQPGMTVFDIGANHGLYSVLASKRIGRNGQVYAFEPSPRERAKLSRNLKINGCKNVQVVEVAMGETAGEAILNVVQGTEVGCNSLRAPDVDQPTIPVKVKIQPLDNFLTQTGVKKIDFVKLDVEGAEQSVLKGGEKYFNSVERPVILAEVSDIRTKAWGYAAHEIVSWLVQRGYEWFSVNEDGGLKRAELTESFQDHNLVAVPPEKMKQVRNLLETA
jgi:FkbM family methyltransferase